MEFVMRVDSVHDIREFFKGELADEAFTIDKTGQKTIELIGASFLATEPAIFGKPVQEIIQSKVLKKVVNENVQNY